MAQCPICDAKVSLGTDTVVGELITCPECASELEVLNLDPDELGEAPAAEEDWGE